MKAKLYSSAFVSLILLTALTPACKTTGGQGGSKVSSVANTPQDNNLQRAIDVVNQPSNVTFNYVSAINKDFAAIRSQLEAGTLDTVSMEDSETVKFAQNLGLVARAYSNYLAKASAPKEGLLTTINSDLVSTISARRKAVERWAAMRIVNHGEYSVILFGKAFFTTGNATVGNLKFIEKIIAKRGLDKDDTIRNQKTQFYADTFDAVAIPTAKINQAAIRALDLTTDKGLSDAASSLGLINFEKAFPLSATIQVGFENQPMTVARSLWYAELANETAAVNEPNSCDRPASNPAAYNVRAPIKSAIEAQKAIYSGINKSGFAAMFDVTKPSSKLDFDPTPNRKWKADFTYFSLSRSETTNEAHDGFAELLDKDYVGAAKGMICRALPWSSGAIRQVNIGGRWVDVLRADFGELISQDRNSALFVEKNKGEIKEDEEKAEAARGK